MYELLWIIMLLARNNLYDKNEGPTVNILYKDDMIAFVRDMHIDYPKTWFDYELSLSIFATKSRQQYVTSYTRVDNSRDVPRYSPTSQNLAAFPNYASETPISSSQYGPASFKMGTRASACIEVMMISKKDDLVSLWNKCFDLLWPFVVRNVPSMANSLVNAYEESNPTEIMAVNNYQHSTMLKYSHKEMQQRERKFSQLINNIHLYMANVSANVRGGILCDYRNKMLSVNGENRTTLMDNATHCKLVVEDLHAYANTTSSYLLIEGPNDETEPVTVKKCSGEKKKCMLAMAKSTGACELAHKTCFMYVDMSKSEDGILCPCDKLHGNPLRQVTVMSSSHNQVSNYKIMQEHSMSSRRMEDIGKESTHTENAHYYEMNMKSITVLYQNFIGLFQKSMITDAARENRTATMYEKIAEGFSKAFSFSSGESTESPITNGTTSGGDMMKPGFFWYLTVAYMICAFSIPFGEIVTRLMDLGDNDTIGLLNMKVSQILGIDAENEVVEKGLELVYLFRSESLVKKWCVALKGQLPTLIGIIGRDVDPKGTTMRNLSICLEEMFTTRYALDPTIMLVQPKDAMRKGTTMKQYMDAVEKRIAEEPYVPTSEYRFPEFSTDKIK